MCTRSWFLPIAGLLTSAAWLALGIWQESPYGRYLDHGNWTEIGLGASICSALPAAGWALPAALYIGGWMLMTAAMMLPTTLPLLDRFRRLVAARPERGRLIALLITCYLLAGIAFGLAAHLLDTGLHLAAQRADWLVTHGWLVGVLVLATGTNDRADALAGLLG